MRSKCILLDLISTCYSSGNDGSSNSGGRCDRVVGLKRTHLRYAHLNLALEDNAANTAAAQNAGAKSRRETAFLGVLVTAQATTEAKLDSIWWMANTQRAQCRVGNECTACCLLRRDKKPSVL